MLPLTADNALAYVRAQGWLSSAPARVETLGGGVSNVVLRVESPERTFVLKQSCPQLRTRDAWFSDLDRVYREQEVMQLLQPLLPPLSVPDVLFVDRTNYVFAMSHAPADAMPWKDDLLAGRVESAALGELAGYILGRMHQATAVSEAARSLADPTVFVQLRVEPFYRRVQERRPEVALAVGRIVDQMLSVKEALCHGDYTPKNLLVHDGGFTLVDYETAYFGDPTMDLGLFLCHLLLKAVKNHALKDKYFALTRVFWRAYASEIRFRPLGELEARALGHLASCLLARIDGTSPVDYLPEERKRQTVRRLGASLLHEPARNWEEVLERCAIELTTSE
jgi:5-methylthioribose kinase